MHRIIGSFSVNNQSIISHFLKTQKCYYIRCKYNKQTTIGSQKICYYKRIVTIYDVTISGLKCITEIGKLQGPSIYCYYMRIVTISGVTIYGLHCTLTVFKFAQPIFRSGFKFAHLFQLFSLGFKFAHQISKKYQ